MEKLFLLPMVLLMLNCSNSNINQQASDDKEDMEQSTSIGTIAQQPKAEEALPSVEQTQEQKITIDQGIAGKVVWQAGNQMPSPDVPVNSGKSGIKRTVYIYELTKNSQTTTTEGVFHSNIQTKLVTQVVTDANGNFQVRLEPGTYTIFTKEDQGLYANLFDGENNIFPVEVLKGKVANVEFLVNYAATY
jgi:hypothetical protein